MKEDQERTNVLSTITPVSINPLSEIAKSSTAKQPIIPKGALPTPAHSPPGTPITPSNTNAQNTTVNLTAPIHGGLASSLGTASLASSLSGLVKPQKTKKKKMKVERFCFIVSFDRFIQFYKKEAKIPYFVK